MSITVLIAYDGSKHSTYAIQWYIENIHQDDNKVILVHSNEPDVEPTRAAYAGISLPREEWEAMVKALKEKEDRLRADSLQLAKQKGVKNVKFISRYGHPGEDIVQTAVDEHCNLIIVGSRGLGMIRRTLVGSVSNYVLHHAHAPVVVCKLPHAT